MNSSADTAKNDPAKRLPGGCAFLVNAVGFEEIQTPETFGDAQRRLARVAAEFMETEVFPRVEQLEQGLEQDAPGDDARAAMAGLIEKAGGAGLLTAEIPTEYGGLQLDKTSAMLIAETFGQYAAFAASCETQITLGMLPTLYFGTPAQKKKWLPKLGRGESIAAYALTEAASGSDALAAQTTAVASRDGEHFELNGSKTWVTNAGIADLLIVFCQVDGNKFSAILVEADAPGITLKPEILKMGRRGASTCDVDFDRVRAPVENALGDVGKGHKVAFNILNLARFKLAAASLGTCKRALGLAAQHANRRRQFGQAISGFGAIRAKLAAMATRAWTLESMCYRVAGYVDARLDELDEASPTYAAEALRAMEEFAVEDAIIKVFGSEAARFVSDEAVQIHGGRGYSADFEVERIYRDARLGPLSEGTNEICRMLVPSTILKRTMKGQLNLFETIQAVEASLKKPDAGADELNPAAESRPDGAAPGLALETRLTEGAKNLVVYTLNQAIQKHMADLREQQEILLDLADMIIELFAMDSTVVRTRQLLATGAENTGPQRAATRLQVSRSAHRIRRRAERLLTHLAAGDTQRLSAHLAAMNKLSRPPRIDEIALERQVARAVVDAERYPF
jgi:alkylation response protein AidB-like acyl-CoA dehydrogenase